MRTEKSANLETDKSPRPDISAEAFSNFNLCKISLRRSDGVSDPDDLQAEAASRFKMLLLRCKKCRRKNASTEHPPAKAEGGMLAKIIGTLDLQFTASLK